MRVRLGATRGAVLATAVVTLALGLARRAAADEVEPTSEPPDAELEAPTPQRAHFVFGAGAGATALALHSDALVLGGGLLTFGADTKVASFDGLVRYEQGRTEYGLTARSFSVAAQFSWVVDRIRLGIALGPGFFGVDRITTSGSFGFLTIGAEGLLGVDLVRTGGFSLGLTLRPRLQGATQVTILGPSDDAVIGGATLGLEMRVRAPRRPKKSVTPAAPIGARSTEARRSD